MNERGYERGMKELAACRRDHQIQHKRAEQDAILLVTPVVLRQAASSCK
jgi:hypothetical protein